MSLMLSLMTYMVVCQIFPVWGESLNGAEAAARFSCETESSGRLVKPPALPGDRQYICGLLYYYGYGRQKDRGEAAKWLHQAAKQGHYKAQYRLYQMYEAGDGVKKDSNEALKWLQKAADGGSQSARYQLAAMGQTIIKLKSHAALERQFLIFCGFTAIGFLLILRGVWVWLKNKPSG